MGTTLGKYNYRGWVSTEIRIGKDLEPYMIDATCRSPSPPSELLQEFYSNFSEIIWGGAQGAVVDPVPAAEYGVQVLLKSAWAEKNWQPVEYPEEFAPQIKLFNAVDIDGKHFVVPQDEELQEIGAVIGWGKTPEAAVAHMQEAADSIQGFGIQIPMGSIDKAKEQMEELADYGIDVFSPKIAPYKKVRVENLTRDDKQKIIGAETTVQAQRKSRRAKAAPPASPRKRSVKLENVARDSSGKIISANITVED
jgi:hypothetical protein